MESNLLVFVLFNWFFFLENCSSDDLFVLLVKSVVGFFCLFCVVVRSITFGEL